MGHLTYHDRGEPVTGERELVILSYVSELPEELVDFARPGHAFFPTDENEGGQIIVWELPIRQPMEVQSTFGSGLDNGIFTHGDRRSWPL